MEFSKPEYWSGWPFPSPDLPNPGIKPRSPTLRVDYLPAEPQRKPKNAAVGSLSLFQWIFLTQELNLGFLHCRWILCQLSYQGSSTFVCMWLLNGCWGGTQAEDLLFAFFLSLSMWFFSRFEEGRHHILRGPRVKELKAACNLRPVRS